jgi:hypothetical protein
MYKEVYAHDTLTKYLSGIKGVKVEKSYLLPTAFRATFSYGKGGKVVGVNSECIPPSSSDAQNLVLRSITSPSDTMPCLESATLVEYALLILHPSAPSY